MAPAGIVEDVPGWEVGPEAWTGGNNVRFTDGLAGVASTEKEVYVAPMVPILYGIQVSYDPQPEFLFCGPAYVAVTSGGAATIINPVKGWVGSARKITGCVLAHLGVLNDPAGGPFFYGGGKTIMQDLPGWDYDGADRWGCGIMRAYRNFLVALNWQYGSTLYPDLVRWSSSAGPGEIPGAWAPTVDNDAGDVQLGDADGPIVACEPLGDGMAIYKAHSAYTMQWVGGQSIMAARRVSASVGTVAVGSVCAYGGVHWLLCDGDVVMFDGQRMQSIATRKVRRAIFNELGDLGSVQMVANPARNEIILAYGRSGDGPQAKIMRVYDLATQSWGRRDLAHPANYIAQSFPAPAEIDVPWNASTITWAQDVTAWSQAPVGVTRYVIVSCTDLRFYVLDQAGTEGTVGAWATLTKTGMDCGDPGVLKWCRRLTVEGTAAAGSQARIGSQLQASEPVEWGEWITVEVGGAAGVAPRANAGRYLSVQIQVPADATMRITGFRLEVVPMGSAS